MANLRGAPRGLMEEVNKRLPPVDIGRAVSSGGLKMDKPTGTALAATKGSAMGIAKKAKGLAQAGKVVKGPGGPALQSTLARPRVRRMVKNGVARAKVQAPNGRIRKLKNFNYGVGVGP